MKDLLKQVQKDLETLEEDRDLKEGCSMNRALWTDKAWIESAYHNTLRTAIELRKLLNEAKRK